MTSKADPKSAQPGAVAGAQTQVFRFNGLAFVELGTDVVPPGVVVHGYFRTVPRGVYLHKLDRRVEALLVRGKAAHQNFAITVFQFGRHFWHMWHSTTDETRQWLGIEGLEQTACSEEVMAAHYDGFATPGEVPL